MGISSGRFSVDDPYIALSAVGGWCLDCSSWRLQLPPETAGPRAGEQMAALVLALLGLPPEEADEGGPPPLPATP